MREIKKYTTVLQQFIYYIYYSFVSIVALLRTKLFAKYYRSYKEIKGDINPLQRKNICIFSHFSIDNNIAEYVIEYLKALENLGCAIFFISTAKFLEPKSVDKIRPYTSAIITRPNIGRDVAALCIGVEIIKSYNNFENLIFTNDSIYGPLYSLDNIFDSIEKSPSYDVFGITDSWQQGYHLQSYFLILSKKVFNSTAFYKFFSDFRFSNNKNFIIREYEVGLSRMLIKNDFKLTALCNYFDASYYFYENNKDYSANASTHKNPSHTFWRVLIEKLNCPFIKRELILYNPSRVQDIHNWKKVVQSTSYDAELIESNLKMLSSLKFKK